MRCSPASDAPLARSCIFSNAANVLALLSNETPILPLGPDFDSILTSRSCPKHPRRAIRDVRRGRGRAKKQREWRGEARGRSPEFCSGRHESSHRRPGGVKRNIESFCALCGLPLDPFPWFGVDTSHCSLSQFFSGYALSHRNHREDEQRGARTTSFPAVAGGVHVCLADDDHVC